MKEPNPNLVLVLTTIVIPALTWLYHKARGQEKESWKDALWGALKGVVMKLAESDHTATVLREKLTKAAHDALERLSIKRNTVVDVLVATLVERGISEVRELVLERKKREAEVALAQANLKAAVAAMATQAGGVMAAFEPPTNPKVPKLELGEVTRICSVAGCNQPMGHEEVTGHGFVPETVTP